MEGRWSSRGHVPLQRSLRPDSVGERLMLSTCRTEMLELTIGSDLKETYRRAPKHLLTYVDQIELVCMGSK